MKTILNIKIFLNDKSYIFLKVKNLFKCNKKANNTKNTPKSIIIKKLIKISTSVYNTSKLISNKYVKLKINKL
jgi:hypothetical protein